MSIGSRSGEMVLCQKCHVPFGASQDKYRYGYPGASTADSTKVVGDGAYNGVATGTGLVQPGEVKVERRSYCCWEEQEANWTELREEKLPQRSARDIQILLQPQKTVSCLESNLDLLKIVFLFGPVIMHFSAFKML